MLLVTAEVQVLVHDPMDTALLWIRFEDKVTCNCLHAEGLMTFEDLNSMKEKNVCDLMESYGSHIVAGGCFIFGI
jgi:hypothetical protein